MSVKRCAAISAVWALALPPAVAAETLIERKLALAPGGQLALDADSGSVTVKGGSDDGVRVAVFSGKHDLESLFDFSFHEEEGRVEITARKKGKGGWTAADWGPGGEMKWEIHVPSAVDLEITTSGGSITAEDTRGEARLDTSGGTIQVRRIEGDVRAETSGGSIRVERVSGDLIADTSGGGIHAQDIGGDVHADTSGGSIEVLRAEGAVTADTSGGSIRIEAGGRVHADTSGGTVQVSFAVGNAWGGSISASGGSVRVALDPDVDLDLDAATSGGTVVSTVPIRVAGEPSKTELRGSLGAGGQSLQIRASGGSIRIEPL
jgi:hypothetical protein